MNITHVCSELVNVSDRQSNILTFILIGDMTREESKKLLMSCVLNGINTREIPDNGDLIFVFSTVYGQEFVDEEIYRVTKVVHKEIKKPIYDKKEQVYIKLINPVTKQTRQISLSHFNWIIVKRNNKNL